MSILIFLAVLFVLILVHEFGHFIIAKWAGMRVDEFGIGFPPKLFGKRVGETEYTLNALPIGGFVRIYGEDPASVEHDEHRARSFTAKNRLWQAVVLLAGVTMNVLFAWLLFVLVLMMGYTSRVDVTEAGPNAQLTIVQVLEKGPAAEALSIGTEVVAMEGAPAGTLIAPETFRQITEAHSGEPLTLTVRDGETVTDVTLTPKTGVIEDRPESAALGVSVVLLETRQFSLLPAIGEATVMTGEMLRDIAVGIYHLIVGSFTGEADFSQVAGPVGIVSLVGQAAEFGLEPVLRFTAVISLNLALINLLPFPALDGGRLLFVAIESVARRNIDPVWVSRLNMIGFVLLMLLMVAVTYNDLIRLF